MWSTRQTPCSPAISLSNSISFTPEISDPSAETGIPFLSNRIGGLSGKAIKPIAIRCVYEISKEIHIPVIGCGGISTWEDAVEFMLAGASAVQIGSAIGNKWLKVFTNITRGISAYLEKKGMKNSMELVGIAHKY